MPVYLMTAHAYRSWAEDNPRGYVQRDEGLKQSSEKLANDRARRAKFHEVTFDREVQILLHEVISEIAEEFAVKLHGASSCPTHIHGLCSFKSPACKCGAGPYCSKDCPAKIFAERLLTRMKRIMGMRIARAKNIPGRKWFSRGWNIQPVRNRKHFNYLVESYLPEHERNQAGICRIYS